MIRRKRAAAPMAMPAIAPLESGGPEDEVLVSFNGVGVDAEVGREVVGAVVVEVEDVVEVSGRSVDFQASWIMGAYRFRTLTFPAGSVVKPKLLLEPSWQDTVGRVVDLARIRHVWPLRLSHRNPVGQHPTNVSSASIRYCTFHPDELPAIAEHAVVYPAGHSRPGE
jgi:hypothetical protein